MAHSDIFNIINFMRDAGISEEHMSFPSKQEDMFDHWDFKVIIKGREFKIDIKSLKEQARVDYHWIELQNVRGEKGWLYGKADYILFECMEEWLLVKRQTLLDYTIGKTNGKPLIYTKSIDHLKAGYTYQRYKREDITTILSTDELKSIQAKVIKKPKELSV
jgi:hypothetical protein